VEIQLTSTTGADRRVFFEPDVERTSMERFARAMADAQRDGSIALGCEVPNLGGINRARRSGPRSPTVHA
jgi:hypothetical protein